MLSIAHLTHRATRAPQRPGDLAQASPSSQPPSDLLVPLHRHAPKRHAALSFVVAHEGCGTRQQSSGDEDSEAGKHAVTTMVEKSTAQEGHRAAISTHPCARIPPTPQPPDIFWHRRTPPVAGLEAQRRPAGGPQLRKSGGSDQSKFCRYPDSAGTNTRCGRHVQLTDFMAY